MTITHEQVAKLHKEALRERKKKMTKAEALKIILDLADGRIGWNLLFTNPELEREIKAYNIVGKLLKEYETLGE